MLRTQYATTPPPPRVVAVNGHLRRHVLKAREFVEGKISNFSFDRRVTPEGEC